MIGDDDGVVTLFETLVPRLSVSNAVFGSELKKLKHILNLNARRWNNCFSCSINQKPTADTLHFCKIIFKNYYIPLVKVRILMTQKLLVQMLM